MAMTLGQLLGRWPDLVLHGNPDLVVDRITVDSRQAGPDVLFVAVRGTSGDGHRYLDKVQAAGCQAVVVEDLEGTAGFAAVVKADNTRAVPALLSRQMAGNPDLSLVTAGVTGTNGKTTVSYLLRQMLGHLHGPCGLIGTINYEDGEQTQPAPLTTPGGPVFYHWLGRMRDHKCGSVAMEISSHALDQDRTAGLGLDVAIMTNLGRDHLDYHQDLEQYLQAKAGIIDLLRPEGEGPLGRAGTLVLNADDPHLAGLNTGQARVVRFSARPESSEKADLKVHAVRLDLQGSTLAFAWQGVEHELITPLVGRFNVENLAAALAAGLALGFPVAACAHALAGVGQVPGRLERIALPGGAIAVVDYAHTHDALAAVLGACDELVENRLLVVFGCGGDRDRGKRPLMGAVAARGADLTWITSDNPRGENPQLICEDIHRGYVEVTAPRSASCMVVLDRTEGIESALNEASAGDIVVIAGKGHEDYQLVKNQRLHLDDRQIVREWVKRQDDHER